MEKVGRFLYTVNLENNCVDKLVYIVSSEKYQLNKSVLNVDRFKNETFYNNIVISGDC